MDSIKQHNVNSGDLHKTNALDKSQVMQLQGKWHETNPRGAQLGGVHANASLVQTNAKRLQQAYRQQIEPYSNYLQFAVTLTLKKVDTISVKRFDNYGDEKYKFTAVLNDETLESRIPYFTALLRHKLYGNKAKHKNKQEWATPLVIAVIEGRNTQKRTHFHFAIGNVPQSKLANFEELVEQVWERCDFAHRETCVKPITDSNGWLSYITKEVGYRDSDALDVVHSTIPPFIQSSICTESRLLAG